MPAHVHRQIAGRTTIATAYTAQVYLLGRRVRILLDWLGMLRPVRFHVIGVVGFIFHFLAANLAFKLFRFLDLLLYVSLQVTVHVLRRWEIFTAIHAQEGSVVLVYFLVVLVLVQSTELLLTLRTAPNLHIM